MKKELFFICTATMLGTVCLTNLTAEKASAKTSGDYRYVVTGKKKKTCAIRKYLGKDQDVVIPDKIDGYTVTRIGNKAFKNKKMIQSVKLSKRITIIGESAFYGCWALEDITFPQKLHTIKKKAFSNCNLKSISLPDKLKTIGDSAFYNCDMEEINIPQYVESIGTYAFAHGSNGLNAITVDKKNKYYDSRKNCNALIETSSNTLILASNKTVIPDSVTVIGEDAFYDCSKIEEINIPASVRKIEDYAFDGCTSLGTVNFSEGLKSIGKCAFYDLGPLKEIKLPDSLETIGEGAFRNENIESIYIPKSLKKTVLIDVFSIHSATAITVAAGNKYYDSRDNCNAVIETSTNTLVMGSKNTTFPKSVTAIGDNAFGYCTIKEINIPASIKKIGDEAFNYCQDLEKVNLSEGLLSIGRSSFELCTDLKEINLPDSIEFIGPSALKDCGSLKSFNIPKNLKKTDITAIFFEPGWVKRNCPSLTKITVAEGNPYYDSRDNCNAVIETASNTLVLACKETVIPNTVKVINESFLDFDPELVVIPEGVEKIADEAFTSYEDHYLKKVTLPSSLKSIGKNAFDYPELETINYRGSKAQWEKIKISLDKDDEKWFSGVKINYNYKG